MRITPPLGSILVLVCVQSACEDKRVGGQLRAGDSPPASEYRLEPGYRLRLVTPELTYPTMVTFGDAGRVYVAEAGYSYGSATAIPRILEVFSDGSRRETARLPKGPVTAIHHYRGMLYAIGGTAPAEVWRVDPGSGEVTTLITGLPVWGHHFTGELLFGADEKMYFSVGYPSNSGVIGLDDYHTFGYLSVQPDAHDIPCIEHVVVDAEFETDNPFTLDPDDRATTGPLQPFGQVTEANQRIAATPPPGCNGAVMRANADGSQPEVVATGFRNVYGLAFDPQGQLFGIEQGMDEGGSRPVANDSDSLWQIMQGGWYGFPDFPSGLPITDPRFAPAEGPAPTPLLAEHPPLAAGPTYRFEHGSASHHFDFSSSDDFGFRGHLFVAQYGSQFSEQPTGHKVVRLDMSTLEAHDFYVNERVGPEGTAPERPTAVHFTENGRALYLVDFGKLETDTQVFFPSAETGALWVIERD